MLKGYSSQGKKPFYFSHIHQERKYLFPCDNRKSKDSIRMTWNKMKKIQRKFPEK